MKPGLLYLKQLNWTYDNLRLLRQNFEVFYGVFRDHTEIEVILADLGHYWGKEELGIFPGLRMVASNTTSDQHIDIEYCRERGIKVITLKGDPVLEGITAVSELTIGLIVALTRKIIPAARSVLGKNWSRWEWAGHKMLSDMTLGVIGRGRIGGHVYARAERLFNQVLYYDKYVDWDIKEILKDSDIITIHIPLEGNVNFCDAEFFSNMKDGAYFINTSRGEIVDEDALLKALKSGKLDGAATDVLSGEFKPGFDISENKLVQYAREDDNLIITPHIGGSTLDAWDMTQKRVIGKIKEFYESTGSDSGEKGQ